MPVLNHKKIGIPYSSTHYRAQLQGSEPVLGLPLSRPVTWARGCCAQPQVLSLWNGVRKCPPLWEDNTDRALARAPIPRSAVNDALKWPLYTLFIYFATTPTSHQSTLLPLTLPLEPKLTGITWALICNTSPFFCEIRVRFTLEPKRDSTLHSNLVSHSSILYLKFATVFSYISTLEHHYPLFKKNNYFF